MILKVILFFKILVTETLMEVNNIVVPIAIATAIVFIVVTTAAFLVVLVLSTVVRRKSGGFYTSA